MGIKFSGGGNFGSFFDNVLKKASDDAHEHFAQKLAEKARENGMTSADDINLEVSSDSEEFPIDGKRVKRRANEILNGPSAITD